MKPVMKSYTISAKRQLTPAMDYEWLRAEGLKHIEQLASDLWTDYNAHDPGITMLEALCYAITELSYRSDFDTKDLLHGASDQVLYNAREILTSHPLTIADYRKLLIDIEGVNNAWLYPAGSQEIPIFYDRSNKTLQLTATDTPIYINGLYDVVLDFDNEEPYGDLNSGDVEWISPDGEFALNVEFPSYGISDRTVLKTDIISATVANATGKYPYDLILNSAGDATFKLPFAVTVAKHPPTGKLTTAQVWDLLQAEGVASQLADSYVQKLKAIDDVFKRVIRRLQSHRNLCEDFVSIKQVRYEEVALCMDVDISPETDIEYVQAALFFAIENYLNPSVNFYSLKELLDKGWEVPDVYDGVALTNGFIDPKELDETQLRTHIYASDIISLLMDIEGVLSVRNLLMTKYDIDGQPVDGAIGVEWCLQISGQHKPVLSTSRSKILFYKDGFPFHANADEVKDTLLVLKAQHAFGKRKGYDVELTPEEGRSRDTLSYRPVQYDLPMAYGVGEAGLPPHADVLRKAQQRQLKGYLLFFEQLLADFLAQLTHAHALFSVGDIKQTYFAQYLGDIKDSEGLLSEAFENAITGAPDAQGWRDLYENKSQYAARRNRLLDHLLARFAESFNDFALLQYRINLEEQTAERIESEELIAAKIQALKRYPEISANRSQAFNYFPQTDEYGLAEAMLWDTENVSGLEKRVGTLIGVRDVSRRFLYCIRNTEVRCEEERVDGELRCLHRFELTSREGIVLASEKFAEKAQAEAVLKKIFDTVLLPQNFGFEGNKLVLSIDGDKLLETVNTFETAVEANEAIEKLVAEFGGECGDPEGMHLIEHVLLRPRSDAFKLMDLCGIEGDCPCELDTYSFRASVVLPYWPDHFDHPSFRNYVEDRLQEEAPAHIQLKVCWISNDQMRLFEIRYKAWIEALANYFQKDKQGLSRLQEASDELLELLPQLKNIHPQATLHNCSESNTENNPVMLGKTILGTYLNQ